MARTVRGGVFTGDRSCFLGEEDHGHGDTKTQAEGAAEKTAGKVQNAIGGAKDAARDALKK
jgi:hypothetical protein